MSERGRESSSVLGDEERPAPAAAPASTEIAPAEERVTYSMSPGLPGFLGAQRIALAVSSYQSGKFYLIGQNVDGGLVVDERFFRKAMGICVPDQDTILLATLFQIVPRFSCFASAPTILPPTAPAISWMISPTISPDIARLPFMSVAWCCQTDAALTL